MVGSNFHADEEYASKYAASFHFRRLKCNLIQTVLTFSESGRIPCISAWSPITVRDISAVRIMTTSARKRYVISIVLGLLLVRLRISKRRFLRLLT